VRAGISTTGDVQPAGPSTWTTSTHGYIGRNGFGTMNVINGSNVLDMIGYIGYNSGSTGEVTIDGPGSAWTNRYYLYIGDEGNGTLNITNGGAVSNERKGYIGYESGSTGKVTVDGPGSMWTKSSGLYVGVRGSGTLNITGGGTVSNSGGRIGYNSGSTGEVTVDGPGSTWTNSSSLRVGGYGSGVLNITRGGTVSSDRGVIGEESGSMGVITVDGTGSKWINSDSLCVGQSGSGTLTITGGGAVSNNNGYIGQESGSTGDVTVNGPGSTWINSSNLNIGLYGSGSLTITDGGEVTTENDTLLSHYSGSSGSINFDNGTLTTGGFLCGLDGLTGTGTINTHGLVSDVDLVFDATHGQDQTFNINDNPGQDITVNLNVDGSSFIGIGYGDVGTMSITDGRVVESTYGYIGYKAGSTGEVTVDGTGSTWTNSYSLIVDGGDYDSFGSGVLNITGGGAVICNWGTIGEKSNSTGEVTVDGPGSTWTNSSTLNVGYEGRGVLNITGGGIVNSGWGYIGHSSGSTGEVTVDGTGSTWTNSSELYVGKYGSGILNITGGGAVNSSTGYIESRSTGEVMVKGAGSKWTNSSYLYVGRKDSGTLNITDGGAVSNNIGFIGYKSGSMGEVTVDGLDSIFTNSSDLYIGGGDLYGHYGSGMLNITDGGLVSVAGILIIDGDLDGDGFVNMSTGGMLALYGDADDSLIDFLGLVNGTDAIRYWDDSVSDWADITGATYGQDYMLSYLTEGDLAGYTMLTVPEPATLSLLVLGGVAMLRRRRSV